MLDKHKQDQTLTGHGSNLLLCRGSESSGVDTWQQTQASWLQIWCEHQVSSGFGIKIFFFFFFQTSPQGKTLILIVLGGLTITADFL